MGVSLRMLIYVVSSWLGGAALFHFDPEAWTLTVDLSGLETMLLSVGTVGVTWVVGRWRKARGGTT